MMTTTTLAETAKLFGTKSAAEYREEFGVSPAHDGLEAVGDWDSTAWEGDWNQIKRNNPEETQNPDKSIEAIYDACLATWREGFWA